MKKNQSEIVTGADANLLELIVVAAVTATIAGRVIRQLSARRNTSQEADTQQ